MTPLAGATPRPGGFAITTRGGDTGMTPIVGATPRPGASALTTRDGDAHLGDLRGRGGEAGVVFTLATRSGAGQP